MNVLSDSIIELFENTVRVLMKHILLSERVSNLNLINSYMFDQFFFAYCICIDIRAFRQNNRSGVKSGHVYILSDKKDVQNMLKKNKSRFKHVKKTGTHSGGWKTTLN